jgi:repressor LexA
MNDLAQLTNRQREVYEFIREQIESCGYPPTVREIGLKFEIESPNGVMCHLNALVKKGLISRDEKRARAIHLAHPRRVASVPLLGNVAAGTPIDAIPQEDHLELDTLFCSPKNIALRVRGQSMIDDHINDGDFVIIRQQKSAENGERVVAMVDNQVTLKRFYKRKDHIELQPANHTMNPIIVTPDQDPQILGVLVGVVRKC